MQRLLPLVLAIAIAAGCDGPTASTSAPGITLDAHPAAVASGQTSTLTWSTTDATGCTASGGWNGTRATSGSLNVSPTSTTTYTLECTGAGGTTSQSATVTVVPPPTVTLTANPATIAAGQASSLTWSTTNATSCTASGGWSGSQATGGSQSVSPGSTTTYTLACTGTGGTTSQSATVTVVPPPTVTFTADPASIAAGQTSILTWSSTDAAGCTAGNGWSGAQATSGSQSVSPSSTTTYTLACAGTGGTTTRSAIVTISATPAPPTVTLTANPTAITAGQTSTLTWSSVNATSCTASGGWTGSQATSGSLGVSPTSTTTYTLACTGTGGATSQSVTVSVGPAPTVTLTANPASIASGQASTLTWSSTDATDCTASGGWSGTRATSGSLSVSPTSTTTYTLACSGAGGTATQSATVTVVPAPSVTLTANPTSIDSGQSSTLTWSSTNATSCTASGGWSGTRATSGSLSVSPTSTTSYALACTGTGGTASQSATVTVVAAPTVTLTANPTSIASGQASTLTWSSTNATSCTASGGWSGARATSGTLSVSPTSTTTYTLACTGAGGTTSRSATVTVGTTPPGSYVYPLQVGPTGRYLVDQTGKPFLLVGDAAWSLIAQLGDSDADTYLANRQQLGFTLVLANLIEHKFADHAPADIYGLSPFTGKLFTTPNEAYFAHVDHIIQSAAQKGIVVMLAPTYLGSGCGDEGWCAEIQSASDADMTAWGQFLGARYAGYDNIIWVIGGDTDPSASVKTKLVDVVNGIRQFDTRHLFTAHNQRTHMAVAPWSGATWLTVNDTYTDGLEYTYAQTAYALSPALPFYLIESIYEGEGASAQALRAQSYWTILSGGFGHVFGNCPIWGFGTTTNATFCSSRNWQGQLNGQGSQNMSHLQKLFLGRHWSSLVPDLSHVALTAGYGTSGSSSYATAAYAADSSSLIAYLPSSRAVTVSGARLAGSTMTAWWYNPGTGAATLIGTYPTTGTQTFTPPASGDWVLVVDSPNFNFPAPGS